MLFTLDKIPADKTSIAIFVFIHQAEIRNQHFGMIANSAVTLVNQDTNVAIAKFSLVQNYAGFTAMHVGNLNRTSVGWEFDPQGVGANAAPNDVLAAYS